MGLDNEKLITVPTIKPISSTLPTGGDGQIMSMEQYQEWYVESIKDPEQFFGKRGREMLSWYRPFDRAMVLAPKFADSPQWFINGELNASYNCVDRHAHVDPDRVALIYEADEPGNSCRVTYSELLVRVCQTANYLESLGVRKGDVVTVYMPMIPETIATLLAISRLGAIHSVVFAGFSSSALKDRIENASSRFIVTTDQARRAGKIIETKKLVDAAVEKCPWVEHVIMVTRTGEKVNFVEGRDHIYEKEVVKYPSYCSPVNVGSEHPLFLLYTSGSTGKPKGLVHATAGYLLAAMMSGKYTLGQSPGDIQFTPADIGWITGHSHAMYAPLLNGITTVIYEGTPTYPSHTRFWEIVDQHKCTQLYTAPTAIRLLRKFGSQDIKKFDLSSLRVLASAGEPLARDVWEWFFHEVGRDRCAISDQYWLTESGMTLINSFPGSMAMKPGSAGLPFFGTKPVLLTFEGKLIEERPAEGVLVIETAWPSIARTVNGDHARYKETYLLPYPGYFFTGDGAAIDKDGFTFITGRVDDVVNVSGHRLSTAEVEAALVHASTESKPIVTESAVIGIDDDQTGQQLVGFIVLENWLKDSDKGRKDELVKISIDTVRESIGKFAAPKKLYVVNDLPKTRSGKIMRRVLRKISTGQSNDLGELSTLNNPDVIPHLIKVVGIETGSQPRL